MLLEKVDFAAGQAGQAGPVPTPLLSEVTSSLGHQNNS